jgi:DnaK suppressor protein
MTLSHLKVISTKGRFRDMTSYSKPCKRLDLERKQLIEKLELLKIRRQPPVDGREGSPFGKREEEASETFEFEKGLALEIKLRETLAEIEHALDKCRDGTYGKCDLCGQAIDKARLEALPQASLCMKCKSRPLKYAKEVK